MNTMSIIHAIGRITGFGGSRPRHGFFDRLLALQARAEERHRLGNLDNRMLRDIGLSRAQAEAEARRPLWR